MTGCLWSGFSVFHKALWGVCHLENKHNPQQFFGYVQIILNIYRYFNRNKMVLGQEQSTFCKRGNVCKSVILFSRNSFCLKIAWIFINQIFVIWTTTFIITFEKWFWHEFYTVKLIRFPYTCKLFLEISWYIIYLQFWH